MKPQVPSPPYQVMKEIHNYQGRSEKFRFFMHCTLNPFLRERLYYRQYGRCTFCGKQISSYRVDSCVHHNSYDHYCQYSGQEISVHCPKGKKITSKTPNCEVCFFKYAEKAKSCLEKLCLLHSKCHQNLHVNEKGEA